MLFPGLSRQVDTFQLQRTQEETNDVVVTSEPEMAVKFSDL